MAEATVGAVERGPAPRWWGLAATAVSLAGFGVALYLTVDHFTGTPPVCSATGIINCAKVTTSPQSSLAGVPVALLGLLFFAAMVVVNLPPMWHLDSRRRAWLAWARLVMAVAGMGFVIWLLYAELFLVKAICLWCTGVHVLTFVLFVLVVATFSPLVESGTGRHSAWEGGDDPGADHTDPGS